jgi:NADH dehydrogenase [ubiquinone] 1 alpha subcomplex assembly factor 7
MTPLERIIIGMIQDEGPMPLDRYMALCLGHPLHGYYMTRDPFGVSGDFTTAPEISQVFGELIGIWCGQVWHMMGSPSSFALVELGPGRGTLMKDLWRATAKVPGFHAAAETHFVEISPVLREAQKQSVDNAQWYESVEKLPFRPSIVIANEFFDAIPIRQFEQQDGKVYERVIGLTDHELSFALLPSQKANPFLSDGVFEDSAARSGVAFTLGHLIKENGGAGLIIDYGHRKSALGDTLQALKAHTPRSLLETPGQADITSHVDFEELARAFQSAGVAVNELLTQGEFLNHMGLAIRTEALARTLRFREHDQFVAASKRLADDVEMGQLFKVLAVTHPSLQAPYPFGAI